MTNPIQQAQDLGQAVWLDYIRRGLITSGELQQFIDMGISGITSNPTIFEKAIVGSTDYDEALLALTWKDRSIGEIYEALALEDIGRAADLLRPTYDHTGGLHGYVSLEVNPTLAYDTEGSITEARRLFSSLGRPNVMIKVPATPEGIPAIRQLISEGININVTLIFSLEMYRQVTEAYIGGLEDLAQRGGDISPVASVASFFLSRVDTVVDTLLQEHNTPGQGDATALRGKAAIANVKMAYMLFKETFEGERFSVLRARGARVQRPLWASTGTKNHVYIDVLYVEPLIGADTVNTLPPDTLNAFLDHGHVAATLEQGISEAEHILAAITQAGVSLESVTARLLDDGVKAFTESFQKLLEGIDKKQQLLTREHAHPGVSLGECLADVEVAVAKLAERDDICRIWKKDPTVWKPDPTEITNRLGWLTVIDQMREQIPSLEAFAQEVRDAGFRYVVLIGMGGSSLGPEVIRQFFGNTSGYPEFIVLDSIDPDWIQRVEARIEPAYTLFIISSKSGTTIEPLLLLEHFKALVETAIGKEKIGGHFVAITDDRTPLAKTAGELGFRRLFTNPSDIGGRYSVLSYFGLVPAVLLGVDIGKFIEKADCMRWACASCVPAHDNPGGFLGTIMGAMARLGRDKLTLITSPAANRFGLWVEQLIAESTGKEGTGIIPVTMEPLVEPRYYGDDRLFIFLRLEDDDNTVVDDAISKIRASGQPVVTLEMQDRYELGAEFFRWEFAIVVAGSILGINPFNQPDVQKAKDVTTRLLEEHLTAGRFPQLGGGGSVADLMSHAGQGKYLAVMAYIIEEPRTDELLAAFRRKVVERYRIATTLGYGPRFLHSTGQLHKGGPDSGMFLSLTANHDCDRSIPGKPYTFGMLTNAQAMGDFEVLQSSGRTVININFPDGDRAVAGELIKQLPGDGV